MTDCFFFDGKGCTEPQRPPQCRKADNPRRFCMDYLPHNNQTNK